MYGQRSFRREERARGSGVCNKREKEQCLPPEASHSVSFAYGTKPRPPRFDLTDPQSHAQESHGTHVSLDDAVLTDPKAKRARGPNN